METQTVLPLNRMARRLGVTSQWLSQQADAGAVPSIKVSRSRYLFNPEAVEQSLSRRAAQVRQGVGHE